MPQILVGGIFQMYFAAPSPGETAVLLIFVGLSVHATHRKAQEAHPSASCGFTVSGRFTSTLMSLFTPRLCHSGACLLVWILVILYSVSASRFHPRGIHPPHTRTLLRTEQIHAKWE